MLILSAARNGPRQAGVQLHSENTGMSYVTLSELPGELEAGAWWGKCFSFQRKPPVWASLKHPPHQHIWSAATDSLGHNSQQAHFNQRHASFLSAVEPSVNERKHVV